MKKWMSSLKPHPGDVILNFLRVRPAYPYEIWRHYCELIKAINRKAEKTYHIPTYISFYQYFYVLKELGVIRKFGESKDGNAPLPRQYYELVPNMDRSAVWKNIKRALYH